MSGVLYLVGTPIGNLEDITLRALRILKEVDFIACEDTRVTSKLLAHYQIKKSLLSYFEHNKDYRSKHLVQLMLSGKNIALVSNAGTPLISDPGYELVKLCAENGIRVIGIPGPSALITALSVSGLPTAGFVFEGFLPLKPSKRKKHLEQLRQEKRSIVIYEAPHRIHKTLAQISEILGNRPMALCREMTKFFEEIKYGLTSEIAEQIKDKDIKGEITLVISGFRPDPVNNEWDRLPQG
ncbi:MAG: 16S rRNA (cytidine(1402)-2'-O)-methyltransferase [Candidatus Brocadiia bacterium]